MLFLITIADDQIELAQKVAVESKAKGPGSYFMLEAISEGFPGLAHLSFIKIGDQEISKLERWPPTCG